MSSPSLNLLLLLLLLMTIVTTVTSTSTPRFIYTFCGNDTVGGSYTPNSPFQSNLNSLLFTTFLNSNSSCGATDVNSNSNSSNSLLFTTFHGLYYCRGDVAGPNDCRACVQAAAARVVQDCPASKEAVIWYDACTLRYANRAFPPAEEDESLWVSDQGPEDEVDGDGGSASRVGSDLLEGLVGELGDGSDDVSGSSLRFFRKGRAKVDPTLRMEMSVQCSPWISESACEACVRASVGVIPSCCGWRREWVMIFRTCCEVEYRLIKTTDDNDDDEDDDDDDDDQDDDRDSRQRRHGRHRRHRHQRARQKQRIIKDFGISTAGATTSIGFSYVVVRIYRKLRESYRKSHKCTHPTARQKQRIIKDFGISTAGATTSIGFSYVVVRIYRKLRESYRKSHKCTHPTEPAPTEAEESPMVSSPKKLPPRECPPCKPPCPVVIAQNIPGHNLYYGDYYY